MLDTMKLLGIYKKFYEKCLNTIDEFLTIKSSDSEIKITETHADMRETHADMSETHADIIKLYSHKLIIHYQHAMTLGFINAKEECNETKFNSLKHYIEHEQNENFIADFKTMLSHIYKHFNSSYPLGTIHSVLNKSLKQEILESENSLLSWGKTQNLDKQF